MQKHLFTLLLIGLAAGKAPAQRMVSDAKIVYRMEAPDSSQKDAGLNGGTLTQYMKGYHSRIDIAFGAVRYSYLIDSRAQHVVTLIDNQGDRYLIRAGKEEYEKDLKQYANIQFREGTETREIAGYTCRKATGVMPDGKTFDVYYAPGLVPENRQFNRRFVNLKGIPLQFEILNKNGTKMTMVATKVELNLVPASFFDVPRTGYKEISREELMKMGGN